MHFEMSCIIDESGDSGNYLGDQDNIIEGSSKFFTLAGIIVDDRLRVELDNDVNCIIEKYFSSISLSENFKIHYHPLRNKLHPYDKLSDTMRFQLANDMFDLVKKSDCHLLAVTIDLEHHCRRYVIPAYPKAHTILIMMERFQDFFEENNAKGKAIYEKFNKKKTQRTIEKLKGILRFRHYKELNNIRGYVEDGDPKIAPISQIFLHVLYG